MQTLNLTYMLVPFLLSANHFFADFFCQTDKMAINKSKSNKWLTIHVLAYMIAMCPMMLYMSYQLNGTLACAENLGALYWLLANGVLHWITDYLTSRLTSRLYKKAEDDKNATWLGGSYRHWFFTAIGCDQLIHYACLFFTWEYFIN